MKILHLNTYDTKGGAALGVYVLNKALNEIGLDSKMLVQTKYSNDDSVIGPKIKAFNKLNLIRPGIEKAFINNIYKNKKNITFYPNLIPNKSLLKRINEINPDIIHLHWVSGAFLDFDILKHINKPIIWTLRDMWAFTGGCHYSIDCQKYTSSCGNCPILGTNKEKDLSNFVWQKRFKALENVNIHVTAISKWLAEEAKKSSLLGKYNIQHISNGIDISKFNPEAKSKAKEKFSFDKNKKIILFGAVNSVKDPIKGFEYLINALNILYEDQLITNNIELVVFGSEKQDTEINLKFKTHYMGYINDNILLSNLYSAADVMIVPSRQEAFGKTATEAMACGTPVVAFGATGLLDIIDHKVNGYLAEPFSPEDLANGIKWIINNNENYTEISLNARKKVENCFNIKNIALQYKDFYTNIISSVL